MNNIKHVIWDWNGTLVDDAWLFVELMNDELHKRNLTKINVNDYKNHFTFPVKKYYENLGFDFKVESFKKVGHDFINNFKQRNLEPDLYSNVSHILKWLKQKKITQSILSAQENSILNKTVPHYKIDHYFTSIAGIKNIYANNKTDIAVDERKKIHLNDYEILMIGDSSHDFEVAKLLNIKCILFANGHYSKKRLIKNDCLIIDDHLDLKLILG